MIKIRFMDGSEKEYNLGISALEIAESISPSLKKKSIAAKLNDVVVDLNRPITENGSLLFLTEEDKESLDVLRHSSAHLMAEAVKTMYPHAKFGVGPSIEEGFYYDIDLGEDVLTESDLPLIEKQMAKIVAKNAPIERKEVSKNEALEIFKEDPYKVELINALPEGEIISIYSQGVFSDLCRGPHLPSTKWIKNFKLLSLAGAYWRGDSKTSN